MGQSRRVFTQKFKQAALKLVTIGRHPTRSRDHAESVTALEARDYRRSHRAFPSKARRKPHEEGLARLTQEVARVTEERDFS